MLAPKGKLTKTLTRKSTSRPMTEEEKKKWGTQLEDAGQRHPVEPKPRLQMKGTQTYRRLQPDMPKLKTKKATPVTTSPLNNERVDQKFSTQTSRRKKTVTGTMDGKEFSGTEKSGRRKAVVKVSNPTLGSSKMVDKFNRKGELKSQKFVDRDSSGKKLKVTKKQYASGTSNLGMKIRAAAAKAGIGKNREISADRNVTTRTKYK